MRDVDESSDRMNSYEEESLADSPPEHPHAKPELTAPGQPVRKAPHVPRWAWIVLASLALIIVVSKARPYWSPLFSGPPPVTLSVHRDGDQLRIGWNPAAAAQGAKLEILDGAERTTIPISATMSSLTYAPRTGDIEVRFIALEETAEVRRETVRFLEREPPGEDAGSQAGTVRTADENSSTHAGGLQRITELLSRAERSVMALASSAKGSAPQAPVVPKADQQTRPAPRSFVPPPSQRPAGIERTTLVDAPPPEPSGTALASATRPPLATNGISAPQVAPPPEVRERVQSQVSAEQVPNPTLPAKPAATPERFQPPFPTRKVQPVLNRSAAALIGRDEQMEIILRVQIDETGRVLTADVVPNTGRVQSPFERAAVAAAMQWRFEPARLGDKPVRSEHTVHFIFRHQ